jgi:hydrogenase maturation protease
VRLRVIGVGSPLGDDGVGPAVARRLLAEGMPPDVEVVVRERPGLELLEDLRGADAAVLVDALQGAQPGRVRALAAQEIARGAGLSSHAFGVGAALALADALGASPPLRVVGVEIEDARGEGLTPPLEAALASACARVRRALAELRAELEAAAAGTTGPG